MGATKTAVTCSWCGHRSRKVQNRYSQALKLANSGWRSFGTALYCPECSKIVTRKEGKEQAIMTIMEEMILTLETQIAILETQIAILDGTYVKYEP